MSHILDEGTGLECLVTTSDTESTVQVLPDWEDYNGTDVDEDRFTGTQGPRRRGRVSRTLKLQQSIKTRPTSSTPPF